MRAMALGCVIAIAIAAGAARGQSIFDDDYKPRNPTKETSADSPTAPASPESSTPAAPSTRVQPFPTVPTGEVEWPAPVPSAAKVAEAEKTVGERFDIGHGASLSQHQEAAASMRTAADAGDIDPSLTYVLLKDAAYEYALGGDAGSACDAADATAWRFAVNRHELTATLFITLAKTVTQPDAERAAMLAAWHAKLAVRDGSYATAQSLSQTARTLAESASSAGAESIAKQLEDELAGLNADLPAARAAKQQLARNADDAPANLRYGSFLCFDAQAWDKGLLLLEKSGDPQLAALASREKALPLSTDQRLLLAAGWVGVAKQKSGVTTLHILQHVDSIIGDLNGEAGASLLWSPPAKGFDSSSQGLMAELFHGANFECPVMTRIDPNISFDWSGGPPAPGISQEFFSVRWRGWIRAPHPGNYKLVCRADDHATVRLDGRVVLETRWDFTRERQTVDVTLGDKPQSIQIDFYQRERNCFVALGWIPPGESSPVAIPSFALYHAPLDLTRLWEITPSSPDADGAVTLPATSAHFAGQKIHLANEDDNPIALIWWQQPDVVNWDFHAPPGDYDVSITYGCSDAGATCDVLADHEKLPLTASDTGGWHQENTAVLGTVHLRGTNHCLLIRPLTTPHGTVVNLMRARLTPHKSQ